MDRGFKYRAFISYSHQDQDWAQWLHRTLESYRVPRRLVGQETAVGVIPARLIPVFRDRDELPTATDLNGKVNEALAQSAALIVICSPRSARSLWVNEEVLAFKRLRNSGAIFCLIVDGEPNASDLAGREAEECFAPALRVQLDADGQPTREAAEPIAADARVGKDGKANAKLKLISGLLGVGFDVLKQRAQHQRNQRMAAITALALLVMLITSALAIDAMIARKAAVVAREAAERRQKQAETLVDFMLGDLNDKLEEVSRLDIMEAVDDQAMRYFQSLPTTDVTVESLAQRAKAFEKIGTVRLEQGHLPAAMESFQSALKLAAAVAKAAPEDTVRQLAYANVMAYIGLIHWNGGHLDLARQTFEAAQDILQRARSHTPNDPQLQKQLAQIDNNIGHVLEARGDLAGAKVQYVAVQKLYEALRAHYPANSEWQSSLGDAYDNLGKLDLEQGQLGQAIAAYRANQRIKFALSTRDPANHDAQENLLVSNAILGRTLAMCGEEDAALLYVREAVESARQLIRFEPAQAAWQEDLAYYSHTLGALMRQHARFDEAAAADADAVRILGELVAKETTNVRWQRELAQSQLESARLHLALNDATAAHDAAQTAMETIGRLREKTPDDQAMMLVAAQAGVVLGQIAIRNNDPVAARGFLAKARDLVAPVARSSNNPDLLAAFATTLLLLDDVGAATPAVEKLAAMGYRTPDFGALLAAKRLRYVVSPNVERGIGEAMQ